MLKMLYRIASCWFSSVLTFATLILSLCLSPKDSTTGETSRQGPHHGAQKSTSTGFSALRTSDSKVDSSTAVGTMLAMGLRCASSVGYGLPIILASDVPRFVGTTARTARESALTWASAVSWAWASALAWEWETVTVSAWASALTWAWA